MNPITLIEIRNFQSHAHTVIEPAGAGQLTVLTGPTDSGKSAVFRALRWLIYGGPVYVRTGAKAAAVTITLADGTQVTRERSGSVNRYRLERPGKEPQVFEGFGREIPLEIQHALGIRPLEVAGQTFEINLARQHEPAFLVSAVSAPSRAKILGQIAGVEAVDLAMREAGRDIFDGQRELKQVEAQVAELEEQVRRYDYLPTLGQRIEQLEAIEAALKQAHQRRKRLAGLAGRLRELGTEETRLRTVLVRTAGAARALAWIAQAQEEAQRVARMRSLRQRLLQLTGLEQATRERLQRTAGAAVASARTEEALALQSRRQHLAQVRNRLAELDRWRTNVCVIVERAERALQAAEKIQTIEVAIARRKRLNWVWQALADLRRQEQLLRAQADDAAQRAEQARLAYVQQLMEVGRCPVCGSKTHESHILEVV